MAISISQYGVANRAWYEQNDDQNQVAITNIRSYVAAQNKQLFDQDVKIGNFETNISMLFSGCGNFNSNVYFGKNSSVSNFYGLFYSCPCFNRDITIPLTNREPISFYRMFRDCYNFNSNIFFLGNPNTNIDAFEMFYGCTNFNKPVDLFNILPSSTTFIINAGGMFSKCSNFNQPIETGPLTVFENPNNMFYGCNSFNSNINAIFSGDLHNMFSGIYGKKIDLSKINLSRFFGYNGRYIVNYPARDTTQSLFISCDFLTPYPDKDLFITLNRPNDVGYLFENFSLINAQLNNFTLYVNGFYPNNINSPSNNARSFFTNVKLGNANINIAFRSNYATTNTIFAYMLAGCTRTPRTDGTIQTITVCVNQSTWFSTLCTNATIFQGVNGISKPTLSKYNSTTYYNNTVISGVNLILKRIS